MGHICRARQRPMVFIVADNVLRVCKLAVAEALTVLAGLPGKCRCHRCHGHSLSYIRPSTWTVLRLLDQPAVVSVDCISDFISSCAHSVLVNDKSRHF